MKANARVRIAAVKDFGSRVMSLNPEVASSLPSVGVLATTLGPTPEPEPEPEAVYVGSIILSHSSSRLESTSRSIVRR